MTAVVPIAAVPSQLLGVVLGGQRCQLALFQRGASLYATLTKDDSPIVTTRVCKNRTLLLLGFAYRGFVGDLLFVDTQGSDAPQYAGLGDRWQLLYLDEADLAALV